MIEALLDLHFADPDRASTFNCSTCIAGVKRLRKCDEDRLDFTEEDGNIWPMRVTEGGSFFGFCPAKAKRNIVAQQLFSVLMLCAETGAQYYSGGIAEQPFWWIDLASWFLPRYNDLRFYSRARSILGDGKKDSKNGNHKKLPRIPNKR
jgi:hypothetical protein